MRYRVNVYDDLTDTKRHTSDGAGTVVQLCTSCAEDINGMARRTGQADEVELASNGDAGAICEVCGADQHGASTTGAV